MDKKTYYREYRKKHLDKIRKTSREWARKHPKPYFWNESRIEIQRRYRARHKEELAKKRRIQRKNRLNNDINYRLSWLLRSRIISAIKKQLGNKAYKSIELLGCSINNARNHIESQFKNGMSWDNHGIWEIDHITPVASFNLTNPDEQKKAFNYKNLQPLMKQDNRSKGAKIMI